MKIAIDISPLSSGHAYRGIGTYTQSLVEALQAEDKENSYILVTKPNYDEVDLVHYPYFDFFFRTLPLNKPKPTVVTIHDAIPLVFPEAYPPGIKGKLAFLVQKLSLNSTAAIITDSHQSTKDVIAHLKQPAEKVHTVYLAPNSGYRPMTIEVVSQILTKYGLNKPYFLYVGDINFNKNLPGLLTAFKEISSSLNLVLVSKALTRDNPAANELFALIDRLELEDSIKILAKVPALPVEDLPALYTGAEWYVQPSWYEGFGLPVLEAMACRTPVISSLGGSLKEIVGGVCLTFDPNSPEAMAATLKSALTKTKSEREAYVKKGLVRVSDFSWQKTARETIAIYRKAAR